MSKVIIFEGLSWLIFPSANYIRRGLMTKLRGKYAFEEESYHWASSGPRYVEQFRVKFNDVGKYLDKIIVVGHSFGAGRSIEWAGRYGKQIDLLVTLDPRIIAGPPYSKPSNVRRHVNFYQERPLRGYPVAGAQNILITKTGHTGLPYLPEVLEVLEKELRG